MKSSTKKRVMLDDLMPVFREQLEQNGKVAFAPSGVSMRPMLDSRTDQVYIEKAQPHQIKRWDVVLYQTEQGNYILHRVIKRTEDGFITRGDNIYYNDVFQTYDKLIGRVYQFTHKGKTKSVDALSYKVYVLAWIITYIPRKVVRWCVRHLRKR